MSEHSRGSFLQVIRAEIALPESVDPHDISVYELAARRLAALEDEGWLVRDATPSLYLYRLEWRGVAQVGFVGCAEVDDYDAGRIKRHEFTRPDKEDDRTQHVDTIGANTGPVFLTCRASEALLTLQQRLMVQAPETSFRSDDVDHAVWPIRNPEDLSQIAAALAEVEAFYIADGHHRAASASRVRALRRQRGTDVDAPSERFLTVLFPHQQLRILPYNRVVSDLASYDAEGFRRALSERFTMTGPGASDTPSVPGTFSMYLDGAWYELVPKDGLVDAQDPVARLDVAVLQDQVLAPLLSIEDPRRDERIRFVGGIRGTQELSAAVDAHGGVAFSLFPTAIDELLAVADSGEVMPPKSTWFEPKLRSGLFIHPLT